MRPGDIEADFLYILNDGVLLSQGTKVLTASGAFAPAGENVILVVRSVPEPVLEESRRRGLNIDPHTAYKLSGGRGITDEALKSMAPVGLIPADLPMPEVYTMFGFEAPVPKPDLPPGAIDKSAIKPSHIEGEIQRQREAIAASRAYLESERSEASDIAIASIETTISDMEARLEQYIAENVPPETVAED